MKRYHHINDDLGHVCRACLNRIYKTNLQPEHCRYEEYPRICQECGEVKNIVIGITFRKKLFLLLK